MSAPFVMQVFFGPHPCVDIHAFDRYDKDDPSKPFGIPLVAHGGRPIGRWAIDYVTSDDERWLLFGVFATAESARDAFKRIQVPEEGLYGFRLWRKHGFPDSMRELRVWTDG
jgi:hypothetical protein